MVFFFKQKFSQIAKTILKRKKVGDFRVYVLEIHYKTTVIKTAWYWPKDRPTDQWNITDPEINPYTYIFN